MAKEKDDNKKERADKYEDKVKFDGTFEDMIGMSVKDAEKRVKEREETVLWSDNKDNPPYNIKEVGAVIPYDNPPYFYIRFLLRNGHKATWSYHHKGHRDKELEKIENILNKRGE